jgi:hypothetical protein
MPVVSRLVVWAVAGCWAAGLGGCEEDAEPKKTTADVVDAAAGTDANTASDADPPDTAPDSAGSDDASAESDEESLPDPPSYKACAAIAGSICKESFGCCANKGSICGDRWNTACLKLFSGLDDALLANGLTLPADPTACANGVQTAAKACDEGAVERALSQCVLDYTDPAALNAPCQALAPIGCGAGAGRCDPKGPTFYQCHKAVGVGDSCKLSQPCAVGLECLNTSLTRALVCDIPGATCNLGDNCWDGWTCDQGLCKPGDEPSKKAKGQDCSTDNDCQGTLSCQSGKCQPKICKD